MISPIVTHGLNFAVKFIVTAGFAGAVVVPIVPAHNIYRVDQATTGSDLFRGTGGGGSSDIYRGSAGGGGKVYK